MKSEFLKIVAISDIKTSEKDGRKYKTVSAQCQIKLGDTYVPVGKPTGFNLWEKGPKQDDGSFGAGDWNYATVKVGEPLFGVLVERTVEPYTIREGQAPVNSYRCLVLQTGSEEVDEAAIERAFNRNGHPILKKVVAETKEKLVDLPN